MAKNRMVNTDFWEDTWVATLTSVEKLLFLYLITNPRTNILGIYEIRLSRIALDTGIEDSMVERILGKFQASGRVIYMKGWIILRNFQKHQTLSGKSIEEAKKTIADHIPKEVYTASLQGVQTLPNLPSLSLSKSKSLSDKEYKAEIETVLDYYRKRIADGARMTDSARKKLSARLKAYQVSDLTKAIDNFSRDDWQMKHNAHRGIAWFFHSDDRIESYIHLKPRKEGRVKV